MTRNLIDIPPISVGSKWRMRAEFHLAVTVKPLTSGVAGDRGSVDVSAQESVVTTQAKFTSLTPVSNFFTSVLLQLFHCPPLSLLFLSIFFLWPFSTHFMLMRLRLFLITPPSWLVINLMSFISSLLLIFISYFLYNSLALL
jgi:hypothetical protein